MAARTLNFTGNRHLRANQTPSCMMPKRSSFEFMLFFLLFDASLHRQEYQRSDVFNLVSASLPGFNLDRSSAFSGVALVFNA